MSFVSKATQIGVATIVLALAGCGGSGGGSTTSNNVISASAGGTATSGNVSVVVPPNALTTNTRILITPATTGLPAAPDGMVIVPGTAYDLNPTGLTFTTNATLKIVYDPAKLPAGVPESSVGIYTVTGGAWQPVSGSINATTHSASASLAHFSTYAVLAPASTANLSEYDAVEITSLPGNGSVVNLVIASNGIAAGYKYDGQTSYPFIWQNGVVRSLGTGTGTVFSVNSNGTAAGAVYDSAGQKAALFQGDNVTVINGTDGKPFAQNCLAINDNGDYIVPGLGVVYGGVLSPLPNSNPMGGPTGFKFYYGGGLISNDGKVIGTDTSARGRWALWDHGTETVLPGSTSGGPVGTAISPNGIAAGFSGSGGVIYQNGSVSTIPPLDGHSATPYGVNDSGWAVGDCGGYTVAFLYRNGTTVSLNSLVPSNIPPFVEANSINNAGQIAAIAHDASGDHAYILTPRVPPHFAKR